MARVEVSLDETQRGRAIGRRFGVFLNAEITLACLNLSTPNHIKVRDRLNALSREGRKLWTLTPKRARKRSAALIHRINAVVNYAGRLCDEEMGDALLRLTPEQVRIVGRMEIDPRDVTPGKVIVRQGRPSDGPVVYWPEQINRMKL